MKSKKGFIVKIPKKRKLTKKQENEVDSYFEKVDEKIGNKKITEKKFNILFILITIISSIIVLFFEGIYGALYILIISILFYLTLNKVFFK